MSAPAAREALCDRRGLTEAPGCPRSDRASPRAFGSGPVADRPGDAGPGGERAG